MKVALYKSIKHNYESVASDSLDSSSDYIRLSEFMDIEFTMLSGDEHIQNAVIALSRQREEVVAEFSKKLADIDRQKAELMALTVQA